MRARGRAAEAAESYREAVRLQPSQASHHNGLGAALFEGDDLDGATAAYVEAIRLDQGFAEAFSNLGSVFFTLGIDGDAIAFCRHAIQLQPMLAPAHFHLALALLRSGDFTGGLAEYEWRRARPDFPRQDFPVPEWRGEPIGGRTLLLYGEQGFGDTIHFARYASVLAARGARVILAVQPPLVPLLATVPGVALVVAAGQPLPPFDYHLPLLSAPRMLFPGMDDVFAPAAYLSADPAAAASWRERLSPRCRGIRVGLAWAGAAGNPADRRRSLSPRHFSALGAIPGVTLVSLQKGWQGDDGGLPLVDFTGELSNFAATAALVDALDLVVTVDTAVAHLAAAMGKPVWILCRWGGDWRWFHEGSSSPWYPTARLFRQDASCDWTPVVDEVAAALRRTAAGA